MKTNSSGHSTRNRKPIFSFVPLLFLSLGLLAGPAAAALQRIPLTTGATLTGAKVVRPSLIRGLATSAVPKGTGALITDASAPFGPLSLFPAVSHFTIEFDEGAWGVITGFTNNTVTVSEDISTLICAGEPYIIRQAHTLSTLFGTGSTLQLQGGKKPGKADIVYVPSCTGPGWDSYYYSIDDCYWTSATIKKGGDRSDVPIYHVQGFVIERRGANIVIVISGDTKRTPTIVDTRSCLVAVGPNVLSPLFSGSYLSSLYITPKTMDVSGLKSPVPFHPWAPAGAFQTLRPGLFTPGDIVWLPNLDAAGFHTGGYTTYFESTFSPGCIRQTTSVFGPCPPPPLMTCGFIIEHGPAGGYRVMLLP